MRRTTYSTHSLALRLFTAASLALFAPRSARADFSTIINVPPSAFPSSIGSNTQLNVTSGSQFVPSLGTFNAGSANGTSTNIELNLTGGDIGSAVNANPGSTLNLQGGKLIGFAGGLNAIGSIVHLTGTQITVPVTLSAGATMTMSAGSTSSIKPVTISNSLFDISGGAVGGHLIANTGASVNVSGGSIGGFLAPLDVNSGAIVNVSAGTVVLAEINSGGLLIVSGGIVGSTNSSYVHVNDGGTANISGGAVGVGSGFGFIVFGGGTANVSGGLVGVAKFELENSATANVSGGRVGGTMIADAAAHLHLHGGEFRLNGVLIDGLDTIGNTVQLNLPAGATLSGVLSDGTPIAFSSDDADNIGDGTLTIHAEPVAPVGPPTVNVPSDAAPTTLRNGQVLTVGSGGSVGTYFRAGRGASVNVLAGGAIGTNFEAAGTAINLSGGSIDNQFKAFHGTAITVNGGTIGTSSRMLAGSSLIISAGSLGFGFDTMAGSSATIVGGNFWLDGVPIAGLDMPGNTAAVNIPKGAVLSGILTDGRIINLSSYDGDDITDGTLTLQAAAIPASGPTMISAPNDAVPAFIGNGQTLVVNNGGMVAANFGANWGSHVVVEAGGNISSGFEAAGSTIDIHSGATVGSLRAYHSEVNISGGGMGPVAAISGGHLNISGGNVPFGIGVFGSVANISGTAEVGSQAVRYGGELNMAGGALAPLTLSDNSVANLSGGTVARASVNYPARLYVTGGLLGNSSYVAGAAFISGGVVGNSFEASSGGLVNLSGGSIGTGFIALYHSQVNITGGTVGNGFVATGAEINIAGGSIGSGMVAQSSSVINLIAGSIGADFDAQSNSLTNLSGGSVGDSFDALNGSEFNLSGGSVGADFDADGGSTIHIYGTEFILAGTDITGTLTENIPFTVTNRGTTLSGILLDGSPFDFLLNSSNLASTDYFHTGATLTITLVSGIAGDFNKDGAVNAADYTVWRNALGTAVATRGTGGDGNFDGQVTQADFFVWKAHYGQSGGGGAGASTDGTIPEPASAILLLLAAASLAVPRHRR